MEPVSPVSLARPESAALELEIAKYQPQYKTLPAIRERGPEGRTTSRWKLTWAERFTIFLSGSIWITQMSWRRPLQPILPSTEEPEFGQPMVPWNREVESKTYDIGPVDASKAVSTIVDAMDSTNIFDRPRWNFSDIRYENPRFGFKLAQDETATISPDEECPYKSEEVKS